MNSNYKIVKISKIILIILIFLMVGYFAFLNITSPSHDRNWQLGADQLPRAQFIDSGTGDVFISNIRDAKYDDSGSIISSNYFAKKYTVSDIAAADFFVTSFGPNLTENLGVAHTIISFEFHDESNNSSEYLALSVEARKESDESYGIGKGMLNQYEMIYVWATEQDVVRTRVEDRDESTYRYRLDTVDPQLLQRLFVQLLNRTNEINNRPEFYHTIWKNCSLDLWRQVDKTFPGKIPFNSYIILPRKSGQYLVDLGLSSGSPAPGLGNTLLVPEVKPIYYSVYSKLIRGYDPYSDELDQPYLND